MRDGAVDSESKEARREASPTKLGEVAERSEVGRGVARIERLNHRSCFPAPHSAHTPSVTTSSCHLPQLRGGGFSAAPYDFSPEQRQLLRLIRLLALLVLDQRLQHRGDAPREPRLVGFGQRGAADDVADEIEAGDERQEQGGALAGIAPSSRFSQPSGVALFPGVPDSILSCPSKWERVGSGDPAACTNYQ